MSTHQTLRSVLLVAALVVGALTSSAFAGSDKDTFNKLIGKYAVQTAGPLSPLKPKAGCVCTDSLPAKPGYLLYYPGPGELYCGLPLFNADGVVVAVGQCQQFELLSK